MRAFATLLFLFLAFFSPEANSYSFERGYQGVVVRWAPSRRAQSLYFNPSNSQSLSTSTLTSIAQSSASEWNGNSTASVSVSTTGASPSNSRNDMYFTNNSLFFSGSSVLAVTQTNYRLDTGEILESDVMIKDSIFPIFTTTSNDINGEYIGSVITHEMGHFLGLDHSQVFDSTMFYLNKNGAHVVHTDDVSGIHALYSSTSTKGSIYGKIVGGDSLIGVLGAHVQAISASTGAVVAGTFSTEGGSFVISGLPLNDTYYVYIEPAKALAQIPSYFSESRFDYCESGKSYRGTFYQSCYNSKLGHPVGIKLDSSKKNYGVGNLTIKCGLQAPKNYMNQKGATYSLPVDEGNGVGNAFVGYFSNSDTSSATPDTIEIDLRNYNVSTGDLYLEVKTLSQSFFSKVKLDVRVQSPVSDDTFSVELDSEFNPKLNILGRINLSTDELNNIFTVTITPTEFTTYLGTTTYSNRHFFYNNDEFDDDTIFYLFVANVAQKDLLGNYNLVNFKEYDVTDNSMCPDANNTYAVSSNFEIDEQTLSNLQNGKNKSDENGAACGTVDMSGGDSGGPFGTAAAFILGLFLITLYRQIYSYFSRLIRL